jgi:hypothetical protein
MKARTYPETTRASGEIRIPPTNKVDGTSFKRSFGISSNVKIFSFPLAGFFLLASTLCCCLSPASHSEAASLSGHPSRPAAEHCHTPTSREGDEAPHADCNCGHERRVAVSSQFNPDLPANAVSHGYILKDLPILFSRVYPPPANLTLDQTHSPPFLIHKSTPLFIKNSVLRV